jgi:hypothetical protein
MSSRYILPVVHLVVWPLVAGFVLLNARTYLLVWWGLSIPSKSYGIGGLVLFWIVVSLSARKVVSMLKADALARHAQIPASSPQLTEEGYEGHVHIFPRRFGYVLLIFDAFLFCLPYLSASHDTSISAGTYFLCFGAGCIVATGVIYIFRYRVTTKTDRFVVRAIKTYEVRFADIVDIRVATTQNIPPVGPRAVVSLTNGNRVRFNGMLTGFNELVGALSGAGH